MGCTVSHIDDIVGDRAAAINDILEDETVIRKLSVHSSSLSEKSRQNLLLLAEGPLEVSETARLSSSAVARELPGRPRRDLKALSRLEAKQVNIADSLEGDFESWKREPMAFFQGLDVEADGDVEAYLVRQTKNASILKSEIDTSPEIRGKIKNRVRLRFFKAFFDEAERICRKSGFGELKEDTGRGWASRGRNYGYLRRNLGIGCLFLLPTAIGDSVWEERISIKGKERESVVNTLKNFGIQQKANEIDAEVLGNAILIRLLRPLERHCSASTSTSPSSIDDMRWNTMASVEPRLDRQSEQVYYRVPIMFDYDSPIFVCAQNGDIDGMRYLWLAGLASIDAVDPYGLGILYYSTYYCWRNRGIETSFATFRALVHAGANVGWRDTAGVGNTPMDTMIDIILVESAMRGRPFMEFLSELDGLSGKPLDEIWYTYMCSRGFTELHEVLLRIKQDISLEEYLGKMLVENEIFTILCAKDFTGRTALDWAVEHGWVCAADTLIFYGADVKGSRERGLSMLHLALAGPFSERGASFLAVVELLLAKGADANAIDDEGWTPLHIAASWGSDSAVEILRRYSGDSLVTFRYETANQLATKNRDGHCMTKAIMGIDPCSPGP